MEDKVVLITGSSSGIGEAIALAFAPLNCKLVIHGVNKNRISQVAQRCQDLSPKNHEPLQVEADFIDSKNVERLFKSTIDHYGRIDVLINNAGLFTMTDINDTVGAYKIYNDLIKINLDSAVLLTILAGPHLKATKGSVINISSNVHKQLITGGFAYCTAKAALTAFSKTAAVDLAPDVRVNSVSPGPVATLMPIRCGSDLETFRKYIGKAALIERVGEAEEIARVVLFLASPESSLITGTDIIVDGGSSIKPSSLVMGQ